MSNPGAPARFLYQNLLGASSVITPSSERAGSVGLAVKSGIGVAVLQVQGLYTGPTAPQQYSFTIDSVAGGSGIGQATFSWRRATDTTPRASGILTVAAPGLVAVEYGISLQWVAGSGTQFALGDSWTVTVDKPFRSANLYDYDRDTEWRSDPASQQDQTIVVDLGSAQEVDCVILGDENLVAGAQPTIAGNSANSFGSPPLLETIGSAPGPSPGVVNQSLIYYLTTSPRAYRYWQIYLPFLSDPDGYLRLGQLYLGTYLAMSYNFDRGATRTQTTEAVGTSTTARRARGIIAKVQGIQIDFKLMIQSDRDALVALYHAVHNDSTGLVTPFFVNLDSSDPTDVSLYTFDTADIPVQSNYYGRYDFTVHLTQRARLARSGS